jgi:hypothetical protein
MSVTGKKEYKDYGVAWDKQSNYGPMMSVCLPVEHLQNLIAQARDGKVWVTLVPNKKKPDSRQPDWRVLAPRDSQPKFDPYKEQLPTKTDPNFEVDVPDFKPMDSESVPF